MIYIWARKFDLFTKSGKSSRDVKQSQRVLNTKVILSILELKVAKVRRQLNHMRSQVILDASLHIVVNGTETFVNQTEELRVGKESEWCACCGSRGCRIIGGLRTQTENVVAETPLANCTRLDERLDDAVADDALANVAQPQVAQIRDVRPVQGGVHYARTQVF